MATEQAVAPTTGDSKQPKPLPPDCQTPPDKGLTSAEAKSRLEKYGPNALTAKQESTFHKIFKHFTGPISYMIEAAALLSAIIGHWEDFAIILTLLLFNVTIEMIQDHKASNALAALKKGLAPSATVLRDGTWSEVAASQLVPGDIIKIRLGMIVPADIQMLQGDFASIDQSALTGESLPVTKKIGDDAYSGSVVKEGEMVAVVTATGSNTFFGRTAKLVAGAGAVSHAQKAMFQIGNFLIIVALILAAIMVIFRIYHDIVIADSWGLSDALNILQFVLVLMVAAIPVAMPTVFSVTLALGALELSKRKAIVSKLSSIEEMAGVDVLCSDKTGTLTKNQLQLSEPITLNGVDPQDCILAASLASRKEDNDAIDNAVIAALQDQQQLQQYKLVKFVPFDPVNKRTVATVVGPDGKQIMVAKGAPQVIAEFAKAEGATNDKINQVVLQLAQKGSRALGVARSTDDGKTWQVLGILPMFDPPRDDSADTIKTVNSRGVKVKMITGDDTAIAIETARELGMGTNILNASEVFPKDMDPDHVPDKIAKQIETADGFARVFPEHKYAIVKSLQKHGHLVAMTGDGVNDAPALKQADCGTAVSGATDAARSAAALILTAPGLSVINTAISEARQIFQRITSYTIYRIALTMTIMVLVVASSIFFNFTPLTAVMIVVMSLLDDLPIMSIAYDRTSISRKPIRWEMRSLLYLASVLSVFSILESFVLLLFGLSAIDQGFWWFPITSQAQLQTVMFLQLATGGHMLLFVVRTDRWFFLKPWPAGVLFWAITGTQILAMAMCGFGWLVEPISWKLVIYVFLYCLVWMFIIGLVRVAIHRMVRNRSRTRKNTINFLSKPVMMQ